MLRLDRMASKVPLEAPWQAPRANEWDSQTAWSWMRRNMGTRSGRAMLELAVKGVWAAMPADVSLLHLLFYIHSGGKLDLLLDTEGGAQQDRFVEGAQNLAVKAAGEIAGEVVLGSPVRSIDYTAEDSVTVRADKAIVRARRAIVAIPPTLAGRIAYDPPLPGYRDQLTQRFPMGSCIKCRPAVPGMDRAAFLVQHLRRAAEREAGVLGVGFHHDRVPQALPQPLDLGLEMRLVLLGRVVLGVLAQVA